MKIRHRTPTIFSIYMVDVLCCALGCVVLLWQYNLNEAEEKTAEAKRRNEDLLLTMDKLRDATVTLDSTNDEKTRLAQRSAWLEAQLKEKSAMMEKLSHDLKDKTGQYLLVRVDLDKSAMDKAKLAELNLSLKKDYDDAKAAEALAKKLLADRTVEFDEIKKSNEIELAKLAQNTRKLAALLAAQESGTEALAKELKEKTAQYLLLRVELDKATAERVKLSELTVALKKDYDDAKAAEALAKKAGGELEKLLAELRIDYKNLSQNQSELKKNGEADLAKLAQNARVILELNRKITEADAELAGLKMALDKSKKDADVAGIKVGETKLSLTEALERHRKLAKQVEKLEDDLERGKVRSTLLDQDNARLRNELTEYKDRYKDLANLSTKELKEARELAAQLKRDNITLSDKVQLIQKNIEKRFAGITLKGNRVILLVDMSGSMGYVDENTADPDKWPIVCETVGKVMLSLPDLKQFQVILFNNTVTYPLGGRGKWFDYEGQKSVDFVVKQIKAVKPANGTDIHAAFAEVFTYRKTGLDTVYFFSDGLPTAGEGLPTDGRKLDERQKTEFLSTHVRKAMKVWNGPVEGLQRVRINTIGFFYESPDVGSFLWALAREHDGSFVGMSKP